MNYDYPFINQHLRIPITISRQVDSIYPDEKQEIRYCIKLIVTNLLIHNSVACSKSKAFYANNHDKNYTYVYFISALKQLERDGYIEVIKTGYKNEGFKQGYSTVIAQKGKLVAQVNPAAKIFKAGVRCIFPYHCLSLKNIRLKISTV